jgi:hypothetical protein
MPHAIIRGKNGRRHEVDFGDAPIRVEIYASDETVEIFVEADFETHAQERRRFAILNIARNLFSEASGAAARRSSTSSIKNRLGTFPSSLRNGEVRPFADIQPRRMEPRPSGLSECTLCGFTPRRARREQLHGGCKSR